MDSRSILLDTFRPNNAQLITAVDMQELINSIYDEKVGIDQVIDNLSSDDSTAVLSAYQGKVLNSMITLLNVSVTGNTADTLTNTTSISNLSGGITTTFNTSTEVITVTNGIITNIVPLV